MEEEKQRELTEEEKKQQEENDKNYNLLKDKIESLVDEVYKLDVPVALIEIYGDQLFRNYRQIKASRTKQWDTFIKEKNEAEKKFYSVNASSLEDMPYEDSKKA